MNIISFFAKIGGSFFMWAGWTTILYKFSIVNVLAGLLALGFGFVPFTIKEKPENPSTNQTISKEKLNNLTYNI